MQFSEDEVLVSGPHCSVNKHKFMGCAIVSLCSDSMCSAVMDRFRGADGRATLAITDSVVATVTACKDTNTNEPDTTKLFIGWGCKQEKRSPVHVSAVFELCNEIIADILAEVPISSLAPSPEVVPRCRLGGSTLVDCSVFQ
eukprot:TRINITY_DN4406_c0_g2_i2.p2 TRINITY_DN4406_c0_g2~~TRINITY_DN4406_c0_g2_i2.p2  ORF type:complete len:142 (-),score=18.82 TRINITY_DN4406_c0_g2_i2:357-782(-)